MTNRCNRVDFAAIAAAALHHAERLVAAWLPDGERRGDEWAACNPTRADHRRGSFSVNVRTGAWADFATGDRGGDLISLCAYLRHAGAQAAAARELAAELGMDSATAEPELRAKRRTEWVPIVPVPADAPEAPRAHEFRGLPAMRWEYRGEGGELLGYVCRFTDSSGGKVIAPLVYACRGQARAWRWMHWDAPRPLYGLDRLAAARLADEVPRVLVVEGEKCADAARAELPDMVVITWSGGSNAVDRNDWAPLAGCRVTLWPDADAKRARLSRAEQAAGVDPASKPFLPPAEQPGAKAMGQVGQTLQSLGCEVWEIAIPAPGEVADGWDVADAIEGGLRGDALRDWMRSRARRVAGSPGKPDRSTSAAAGPRTGSSPPADVDPRWRDRMKTGRNGPIDCLANIQLVLANHPDWDGVIAWDEFGLRPVARQAPPYVPFRGDWKPREWTDDDDVRTAIWVTQAEDVATGSARVAQVVETIARDNSYHPVRDWLGALPAHDGVERLPTWLSDFLGVKQSDYSRAVGTYFLVAMIARVMQPGCQQDHTLVLEGEQGLQKTSALRALGEPWFANTDLDLRDKDAMSLLSGVWLYELAEMGAIARSDSKMQKSYLSRREDRYRPVWARREVTVPRQTVFAGSVNPEDQGYLHDTTGARRFWPVWCSEINLLGLRQMRAQLMSEALALFSSGHRWWPDREEERAIFQPEQRQRQRHESYVDLLYDWVHAQVAPFPLAAAWTEGMKGDAARLTRDVETRIGHALRELGCAKREKRNGSTRFWYVPPPRKGGGPAQHASAALPTIEAWDGGDAPF